MLTALCRRKSSRVPDVLGEFVLDVHIKVGEGTKATSFGDEAMQFQHASDEEWRKREGL